MGYDKLIERLKNAAGGPEGVQMCIDAATAIETLRAGLARVTAERDAAVKDLNEFLSMDELCPVQCEWCRWNGTYCDGKTPEWRGIKEEKQ